MDWLIDADAHVTEAPDVWTARLPERWQEAAPRIVRDGETGEDYWYVGGKRTTASVGATAPAGYTRDWSLMDRPRNFDEVPVAAREARARLDYLDSVGIWAQVIYPNVGGFGNQAFFNLEDPELRLACVQAYNDWLLEWCSEDARRLLPVMATPFWDIDQAVGEVERCASLGHRGVLFTGEPQRWGLPFFSDRAWDPFWATVAETGLPLSLHIGSGDMEFHLRDARIPVQGKRSATVLSTCQMFLSNAVQVADLLLAGIFPRHPNLKVVSVESGAGWAPFVLDSLDYLFTQFKAYKDMPEYEGLPSEYFRRNVYLTYFFEHVADGSLLDAVGADNLLFETDFPHAVCLFEERVGEVITQLAGQPDDVRRKLTWANSASLYGVADPEPAVDGR